MNIEVDLGKVWLPEELVKAVEEYKEAFLYAHYGDRNFGNLQAASFSIYFGAYMQLHSFKLTHEEAIK